MRTNIVKKIVVIMSFIIAITLVSSFSYAASSVSIAAGSTSLTVGSSTTLTIRGNNVIGKINITSSNPGVIALSSSSEWLEGAVTIRATAKAAGTAYITVTSADTSDASTGDPVTVSTGVNLTAKAVVVDTRSSNNYLSSLAVTGHELSPAFNANTNNYTMSVGYDVSELSVSAVPSDSKAKTVVDGNLDLVAGENNVTVTVTAENGYKRVYTIKVTKEKNPDDVDATLESLVINNATLKNEFSPDVFEYMCDDITADIEKLDIQIKTKIPDLKYEIVGNDELKQGINHVIIKVTSRDGSVTKEYEIIVFKTDEVLALQETESVMAEVEEVTILDTIKNMKYELIMFGIGLVIIIVVIVIIVKLVKGRNKDDDYENYEEDVEQDIEEEAPEVDTVEEEMENVVEEIEDNIKEIEDTEINEEEISQEEAKQHIEDDEWEEVEIEEQKDEEKEISSVLNLKLDDIEQEKQEEKETERENVEEVKTRKGSGLANAKEAKNKKEDKQDDKKITLDLSKLNDKD